MELHKIVNDIYLVPASNKAAFPFSHAIYIDGPRKILFDSGCGPGVMQAFFRQFKVDVYVASHSHPSHSGSLWMLNRSAIPIFVPQESASTFGNLSQLAQRFLQDKGARLLWQTMTTKLCGFRDTMHTHVYDARSSFDLGTIKLLAVHSPGHTADHYCFFEEQSQTMLLFDIDLSPAGPTYWAPESDISAYIASIELLKSYSPQIVVSSHMGVLRKNPLAALNVYQDRIAQRNDKILAQLSQPLKTWDLVGKGLILPVPQEEMASLTEEQEKVMITKHLEYLMEAGLVGKGDGSWFAV